MQLALAAKSPNTSFVIDNNARVSITQAVYQLHRNSILFFNKTTITKMQGVKITSRSDHGVSFEYEDGSTSYKTSGGSGAHGSDGRREFCARGGYMPDISKLTDAEVIDKYASKRKQPVSITEVSTLRAMHPDNFDGDKKIEQ